MLKIALVDDEDASIVRIKDLLQTILATYDIEYSIITFTDGNDLLNSRDTFDLLLLDIDMPTISGFELVEKYNKKQLKNERFTIIYISSYDDFVFESFKYSPLRFIRKNKLDSELAEAIQAFFNQSKRDNYQILFSTPFGKKNVLINDIMYVEVKSHKLNIHEKNQLTIANGNLKDIEEELFLQGFIKTHQSFLVNFRYINFIKHNEVILDDDVSIPLSRGRYEKVKKEYMRHTREK